AQLRAVCPPRNVSFFIPRNRIGTLGRYAHQYGFAFASSLEKAAQFLIVGERERTGAAQKALELDGEYLTDALSSDQEVLVEDAQENLDTREGYAQHAISTTWSSQPAAPAMERLSLAATRSARKPSILQHIGLIATLVTLLAAAGAILLS